MSPAPDLEFPDDVPADSTIALVTGAGAGLGSAIARRLAADGWHVAVNDVVDDAVHAVCSTIRSSGGSAIAAVADITDEGAVVAMVRELEDVGGIGAVVFNATGPQTNQSLAETDWPVVAAGLEFFAKSPLLLTRAVAPHMIRRGYGRLVHIDSEVASKVPTDRVDYVTGKHAQVGVMRSTALELAPHGITVNSVAPGFVPVERHSDVGAHDREAYRETVPVGRMGEPADVAAVVSFLASPDAAFVTGQRLLVDGGRHLT